MSKYELSKLSYKNLTSLTSILQWHHADMFYVGINVTIVN